MPEYFIISNSNDLHRFMVNSIACVTSHGDYSDIHTCDGETVTVTVQLGIIEEMMDKQLGEDNQFVRIGRSLIANTRFVSYINPAKKRITLSDGHTFKISFEVSREALKGVKEDFEIKETEKKQE